jgi:hypothetical protein
VVSEAALVIPAEVGARFLRVYIRPGAPRHDTITYNG